MKKNRKIDEALTKLLLDQREREFAHHTYEEDMQQYEYLKRGDIRAVEDGKKMFEGQTTGHLSDDPVKNYCYLFIASITLACRFCIEGGMPPETAFSLSDLYIRQVDRCKTVEEIFELHDTMFKDYLARMQEEKHEKVISQSVHQAMDYIEQHLQQPLFVAEVASAIGLSPSYFSTVFKEETGLAVSEFIRNRRIDSAKLLLQYTDYSCLEISEYLCFSSDSHFSRIFKEATGMTPTVFRRENYRQHFDEK